MAVSVKEKVRQPLDGSLRLRLGLAFFAFVLIGATDGANGVLLPSLQNFYRVDKATISLLFLASTLGYLIAAFTSGLLVQKLGQRGFLMLGTGVMIAGAGVMFAMPMFLVAWLGLMLIGFGIGTVDAGLNSYIAALPNNTTWLNYLHAFYGLGALLGPILASNIIVGGWGWDKVYLVWVGAAAIVVVGIGLTFRAITSPAEETSPENKGGNVLAAALRLPVVWLGAVFLLFYVGAEVSLGVWSFSYLTQERGQQELLAGWLVSGYWFGLMLGRLVLGRFAASLGNRRLIQLCLGGVVAGLLIFWLVPVSGVAVIGLWIVGFSLGPIFPTVIAIMPSLVPAHVLPSAIGFLASLGAMGAALFPWLAGNLSQAVGLWVLLPYVIILTVAMLGLWLAFSSNKPRA